MGIGQLFIALRPKDHDTFTQRIAALADAMRDAGSERLPGERRADNRKLAQQQGLEVSDTLIAEIAKASS